MGTRHGGLGPTRTFLKELDRAAATALATGLAFGLVWLAVPGPGVIIGSMAALGGAMAWIMRSRWLLVALVLLGTGLVPAAGYRVLGRPTIPAVIDERTIPVEAIAPPAADLFALADVIGLVAVAIIGVREGAHRERHAAHGEARRARRRIDTPS